MARFNSEMYEKLYPRQETVKAEPVETAVETFNPTAEIDEKPDDKNEEGDEGVEGDGADSDVNPE